LLVINGHFISCRGTLAQMHRVQHSFFFQLCFFKFVCCSLIIFHCTTFLLSFFNLNFVCTFFVVFHCRGHHTRLIHVHVSGAWILDLGCPWMCLLFLLWKSPEENLKSDLGLWKLLSFFCCTVQAVRYMVQADRDITNIMQISLEIRQTYRGKGSNLSRLKALKWTKSKGFKNKNELLCWIWMFLVYTKIWRRRQSARDPCLLFAKFYPMTSVLNSFDICMHEPPFSAKSRMPFNAELTIQIKQNRNKEIDWLMLLLWLRKK